MKNEKALSLFVAMCRRREDLRTKAADTGESTALLEGGWFVLRCVDCTVPLCLAADERMEVRCPMCAASRPPTAPTPEALPGSSDDDVPF